MRGMGTALLGFMGLVVATSRAADLPYVNLETNPVAPLALNADRTRIAIAHTADARVQLIDVSGALPQLAGHVAVGLEPVALHFRGAGELWVVNHLSDSVSVVDLATRAVKATLLTADEPYDIVFAGDLAFVACAQPRLVQVFDARNLGAAPRSVKLDMPDPRALAASADGRSVYVASFLSGNATTALGGGLLDGTRETLPNVVSDPRGPYGGRNPPPNRGDQFDSPVHPAAAPPPVGLIVRQSDDGRWLDDNQRDWTPLVSGAQASASGRRVGWSMPDRDLAIIDSNDLSVRYVRRIMNVGMALSVNPANGELTVVGTQARNDVRFEPNLNGRFVDVQFARVNAAGGNVLAVTNLNPHLVAAGASVPAEQRVLSLGDPRAVVWSADGTRAWISGLGSNNIVNVDASGARVGAPIAVGQGPTGLAMDDARGRLYVWNHFEASLSVIDTAARREVSRLAVFNPLPQAIRAGRPFLYDTQLSSGTGHVACASCHINARMDRLAWDLGDPAQPPQLFEGNCITSNAAFLGRAVCENFHAMKGPMTTQTLQDIVGNEPFHWRGDRAGLEAFNPAFPGLLGRPQPLTAEQMQAFEGMLATVAFPPNPYRNFDNSLPTSLPLTDQYTSGRFAMAGQPLGNGNAVRGLTLYTGGLLDSIFQCAHCHTLPTGMAGNGPLQTSIFGVTGGGSVMATGALGENHLGIVSVDGSSNVSIKVPHLRNMYDKVGFELLKSESLLGFGFLHDGSVDSLSRFLSAPAFRVGSDRDIADLVALMMTFAGSDFPNLPDGGAHVPDSQDLPAAAGAQVTYSGGAAPARLAQMFALARLGQLDLIVRSATQSYAYARGQDKLRPADGSAALAPETLAAQASTAQPQTWTLVPRGLGERLGIDRDGDQVLDSVEIAQGSNPADAASTTLRARAGLWYNPQRSGAGFDLQHAGGNMILVWYTYEQDGAPTWYLASGVRTNPWRATLSRYTWDPIARRAIGQDVGEVTLTFQDARSARFDWRLGARSGSEPFEAQAVAMQAPNPDYTSHFYSPNESGWGLSIFSEASVRVAIVYFYDGANQPRWILGQADNVAAARLPMNNYRGFCPDCAFVPVSTTPGGFIDLNFDSARGGTIATDIFAAGDAANPWRRGPVAIAPLSDANLRPGDF